MKSAPLTFAWLLLDETPAPIQLAGGMLILVGVIVVRLGEPQVAHRDYAVEPA